MRVVCGIVAYSVLSVNAFIKWIHPSFSCKARSALPHQLLALSVADLKEVGIKKQNRLQLSPFAVKSAYVCKVRHPKCIAHRRLRSSSEMQYWCHFWLVHTSIYPQSQQGVKTRKRGNVSHEAYCHHLQFSCRHRGERAVTWWDNVIWCIPPRPPCHLL